MTPTTIALMDDYKDILFYGFLLGIAYLIMFAHWCRDKNREMRAVKRLFLTPEEKEKAMKEQIYYSQTNKNKQDGSN